MSLTDINLDDRKFQDIVDQAKRLIPRYTPEWTDHNVSDPGVALIELFAWMTEMVLYRTNRVPDKVLIRLLELIGAKLQPPRAAQSPITFYVTAAQNNVITIPEGIEIATARTETSEAIIFSSETSFDILPPITLAALTNSQSQWVNHDLRHLTMPGTRVAMFGTPPTVNDAFYLALENDLSQHVLAIHFQVEIAGGAGVDPTCPPLEWQVWQGNISKWIQCEVEFDGTGGFNTSGEIILHLPKMVVGAFQGLTAYWIRVVLTTPTAESGAYKISPDLEGVTLESRGCTIVARHAVSVRNEYLGESEGTPGQQFKLAQNPVLNRDPARDYLIITEPGMPAADWQEVNDFADSNENDPHYTLNSLDGIITLGPTLPQTNGQVYAFSRIPSKGAILHFTRYQHGGGSIGNVPKGSLNVLRSSVPYIARAINRGVASGGADAQNLEDAKRQAPALLRARNRAVTSDDFEYHALMVNGVARSKTLAPGEHPPRAGDPKPGQVVMLIIPEVQNPTKRISPDDLTLPADLRAAVFATLNDKRLVGTQLEVRAPQYIWISVQAKLRLTTRASDPVVAIETRTQAEALLYHYLNPIVGGSQQKGWAFGRDLHTAELYALLQRVPGVEFVEEVLVGLSTPGASTAPTPAPARLTFGRDAVIASDIHRVVIL
jgi:predicted phage baseplate assembly protein